MDILLHLIIGALMGTLFAAARLAGLFFGFALIIGWEVYQAGSGTGSPELLDLVFGFIAFISAWACMQKKNTRE